MENWRTPVEFSQRFTACGDDGLCGNLNRAVGVSPHGGAKKILTLNDLCFWSGHFHHSVIWRTRCRPSECRDVQRKILRCSGAAIVRIGSLLGKLLAKTAVPVVLFLSAFHGRVLPAPPRAQPTAPEIGLWDKTLGRPLFGCTHRLENVPSHRHAHLWKGHRCPLGLHGPSYRREIFPWTSQPGIWAIVSV